MKKNILIALTLVMSLFISCDGDPPGSSDLDGRWQLKTVTGGFAGANETFAGNEVVWSFVESLNQLIVNNNSSSPFSQLPSGTYTFSSDDNSILLDCEGDKVLSIENGEFGCYIINDMSLSIDQNGANGADGFYLEFIR